jgi:Flp pilus assembly pilin Flp
MDTLASFPVKVHARLTDWGRDESGQGMVEYAFIIVMVALVVILTVLIIGNQTRNMWTDISTSFKSS